MGGTIPPIYYYASSEKSSSSVPDNVLSSPASSILTIPAAAEPVMTYFNFCPSNAFDPVALGLANVTVRPEILDTPYVSDQHLVLK